MAPSAIQIAKLLRCLSFVPLDSSFTFPSPVYRLILHNIRLDLRGGVGVRGVGVRGVGDKQANNVMFATEKKKNAPNFAAYKLLKFQDSQTTTPFLYIF